MKTYVNKITMPILLAMILVNGVGHVWSMEKTPEKELPEVQRKAAEEEQKKALKQMEEAKKQQESARKQQEDIQKQMEKAPETEKKALEKQLDAQKKIIDDSRKKVAEANRKVAETVATLQKLPTGEALEKTAGLTPGRTPTELVEKAKEKIFTAKRLLIGGGIGLGGIAGLGLAITAIFEELSQASEAAAKFVGDFKKQWEIDDEDKGSGKEMIPNILPKADPNDENYNKTLTEVVTLFKNFDEDLKDMLDKNTDYASNVIKFEAGKVDVDGTQVAVSIKYDTEQIDVGLPLIPVLITLAPQDLRGFALTPNDILEKMEDGTAKDMLTLVLNPTASFIFTIKFIQLYNATMKDSTKSEIEKIEYMLDETTELYSRFILSRDEDIAPDALLSYLQQYPAIIDVLMNKMVKVYRDLADATETPLNEQKTAFMDMQKSEIVVGPLIDALKIFYNQFSQVYFKKFEHDYGYNASAEFVPSARGTKNMLQAIFYRGLKEVMRAGQDLSTAEGKVKLRKLDGTEYEVDPKADLNNLIAKPSSGVEAAANNLKGAITGLRKIFEAAKAAKKAVETKDMKGAKAAYDKAIDGVKTANSAASKAILEFRKKLAPFYPLTWDDGTSLTPAEFVVANVKNLNDADATDVKKYLNKVYSPFSKHLGLTTAQILGSTQDKLIDRAVGAAKTLIKKATTKDTAPYSTPDVAPETGTPDIATPVTTPSKPIKFGPVPKTTSTKTYAKPATATE